MLRHFSRNSLRQFGYCYTLLASLLTPMLLYLLYFSSDQRSNLDANMQRQLESVINERLRSHIPGVELDHNDLVSKLSLLSTQTKKSPKLGCIIPRLNVRDPDIMQFYQTYPPVTCGDGFDWVSLRGGKFSITPEARKKYGDDIVCKMTALVKKTDFETREELPPLVAKDGSDLTHDFYKVDCNTKDGITYRNYHAGIHRKPEVVQRSAVKPKDGATAGLDIDVIILGQDSLSRMAWTRHLPLTRKFLVDDLKAIEMEGQTIVGDGTPATMFPLLTGKREEELPEARRGYSGAKSVDGFPWIWNEFKAAGYVTSWQEDQPGSGTFHYRLLGFQNDPTDHYYRPFGVYTNKFFDQFPANCLGSKPRIVAQNDYITDVLDVYKGEGQRKWVMSFKSENSHSDNNLISKVDVHMRNHLEELHTKGHLDNAILVVFADHGARFSKIRAFAQGKQEERMPYLAIRLPEKLKEKYPEMLKNLEHNSQRLTTPFDLHVTLHEILNYTGSGPADISKRGVSLFKKIPSERDCKGADVDAHWCFCLDWSPVSINSQAVKDAVSSVLKVINEATKVVRDQCNTLTSITVKSANEMKVKDDVLKFKDTNDGGRGRFGKMSDKTTHSEIVYQISFMSSPGNGEFEATVKYDVKKKTYITSLASVSRINKYGLAPWCIMETIPQLRPYCVCKQPPPASMKEHH